MPPVELATCGSAFPETHTGLIRRIVTIIYYAALPNRHTHTGLNRRIVTIIYYATLAVLALLRI